MRVPVSWLREFVAIPADQTGRAIADRLISAGLEVETVESVGGQVEGPLVLGRVRSIEELSEFRKPIRYCRVDVGAGNGELLADPGGTGAATPSDERGIICGASNFVVGDLVVVALPGAVLPGGFQIASRSTYGRISDGMITSERELGIGDDHSGIMVLPVGSGEPGDPAREIVGLGEEVLDIAVTPDRGYALSIRGVARETAIAYGLPFDDPALADPAGLLPVPVGAAHGCGIADTTAADRFVLRTITGLHPQAASPQWMRRRLRAAGMRPLSLAVDVTNYLMLELGQPLHAFDRGQLAGPLVVRRAQPGERLVTLDHVERALAPADIVIADPRRALALAGTMGGLDCEISETTTEVVIEAVHFDAPSVARMSRRHRLSSEASRRFERGVDANLPAIASARAAALLIQYGGASYVGVEQVDLRSDPLTVQMAADLPARVSGLAIPAAQAVRKLVAIGAAVVTEGERLLVTPPSWRPDLNDPADLVEEVVRLVGYERVPATLPQAQAGFGLSAEQRLRRRVGRTLAGLGLTEVLNYPFVGVGDLDAMAVPQGDPRRRLVRLANPLSDEAPYLRTTLLPGLLSALRRNISRGMGDLALFEHGAVFRGEGIGERVDPPRPSVAARPDQAVLTELLGLLPQQPTHLAGAFAGMREPAGWWGSGRVATWSDAIDTARQLAAELSVELDVATGQSAPWHPGRCAELAVGGRVIGHAGELHPRVIAALELPERVAAFEVDLDALLAAAPQAVPAPVFSTYPVAKEDLAVVVERGVPAQDVLQALAAGAGPLLESIRLFDVYQGAQVGAGKSLAFSLRLRASDRTLSAAEVAQARAGALAEAHRRCGAILRE